MAKATKSAKKPAKKETKSTFKLGDHIFYPNHGAGTITAKKQIEIGGTKNMYFEFKFVNSNLAVSTPVQNMERLGVRHIEKASVLRKALRALKARKSQKPPTVEYNPLARDLKILEESGKIDDSIKVIRYCNYIVKMRESEGRLIPITITRFIQTAMHNLIGELSLAAKKDYDKATEEFEKLTGLKVIPLKR